MRILANENIAASVIAGLRAAGTNVASVKEVMRGATDAEVLARAHAEQRLVITHDKDFGELAFAARQTAPGVVLFRMSGNDPVVDCRRIVDVLLDRSDWMGHFSVVDDRRIRLRPMPGSASNEN